MKLMTYKWVIKSRLLFQQNRITSTLQCSHVVKSSLWFVFPVCNCPISIPFVCYLSYFFYDNEHVSLLIYYDDDQAGGRSMICANRHWTKFVSRISKILVQWA